MIGDNADIMEDPDNNETTHHHDTDATHGENANNNVITQPSVFTTAAQLIFKWCQAKYLGREMEDVILVDALHPHRAPLAGKDLIEFNKEEEKMRQLKREEEEKQAMLREVELARGRLRLGIKQEDKDEPKKKKSKFNSSLFFKFSKPLYLTFEVREEAIGIGGQPDRVAKYGVGESIGYKNDDENDILEDDYGIAVMKDRFVDIVTGVDNNKYTKDKMKKHQQGDGALGFGSDGRPVLPSINGTEDMESPEDKVNNSENEMALEAADLSEGKGILRSRNGRPPLKVSTIPRQVQVLAEVSYVPLEGQINARAARQYVRALQPRQVVILGGGGADNDFTSSDDDLLLQQQQTQALKYLRRDATTLLNSTMEENDNDKLIDLNAVFGWDNNTAINGEAALLADVVREFTIGTSNKISNDSVYLPYDYQTEELDVGHAAYPVRLMDTPYIPPNAPAPTNENEENASDELYEAKMGDYAVSLIHYIATGQKVASDGSIVLAPPITTQQQQQKSVMISNGEVLLSDLRSEIIAQGMKAEYTTNVLEGYQQILVNNKIIVRKSQENRSKIDVDGPLCEDFWIVRNIVCSQYVTL